MKQSILTFAILVATIASAFSQGTSITVSTSEGKGPDGGDRTEMVINLFTSTIDNWTFAMSNKEARWDVEAEKLTGENYILRSGEEGVDFTAWLFSEDYQVDMSQTEEGWKLVSRQSDSYLLKRGNHPCGRAFSLYKLDGGKERLLMKIKNRASKADCSKEDWSANYLMGAPPVEAYIEALALWLATFDYYYDKMDNDDGKEPDEGEDEGKEPGDDEDDEGKQQDDGDEGKEEDGD